VNLTARSARLVGPYPTYEDDSEMKEKVDSLYLKIECGGCRKLLGVISTYYTTDGKPVLVVEEHRCGADPNIK